MSWTQDPNVNSGSPVGPGFVVYERAPGQPGYDRALAHASVGPGWHPLLDCLFEHLDANREGSCRDVYVTQVKEKYGRLRVYVSGGDEFLDGYLWGLSAASGLLCESCGQRGRLREDRPWIATRCDACDAQGR
jgi:hypothetical protein